MNYLLGKPKIKPKRKQSPAQLANLRPQKAGEPSHNPLGGKLHNPLRKMTRDIFKDLIDLAVTSNRPALEAIMADPNTQGLKLGIATALVNAINQGDWMTIERIIDRLLGKEPEQFEGTIAHTVVNYSKADLDEIIARRKRDC